MKKSIILLIVTALLGTSLFSCDEQLPPIQDSEQSDNTEYSEQAVSTDVKITGAQYVRTGGDSPAFEYPYMVKISNRRELDEYYEAFRGIYYLDSANSSTVGWLDAASEYDETFFEEHILYLAVFEEGSGSIRHEVKGITDGVVYIDKISPETQTCDMALWHIFVETDKSAKLSGVNNSTRVYTVEEAEDAMRRYVIERVGAYIKNILGLPDSVVSVKNITRTDFLTVKDSIYNAYEKNMWDTTPVYVFEIETAETNAVLYADDEGYVFASEGILLPSDPTAPSNY